MPLIYKERIARPRTSAMILGMAAAMPMAPAFAGGMSVGMSVGGTVVDVFVLIVSGCCGVSQLDLVTVVVLPY
jgi:hypothetical protein